MILKVNTSSSQLWDAPCTDLKLSRNFTHAYIRNVFYFQDWYLSFPANPSPRQLRMKETSVIRNKKDHTTTIRHKKEGAHLYEWVRKNPTGTRTAFKHDRNLDNTTMLKWFSSLFNALRANADLEPRSVLGSAANYQGESERSQLDETLATMMFKHVQKHRHACPKEIHLASFEKFCVFSLEWNLEVHF